VVFTLQRLEKIFADFGDGGCFARLELGTYRGLAGVADEEVDLSAAVGDGVDGVLELGFGCYVAGYGVDV